MAIAYAPLVQSSWADEASTKLTHDIAMAEIGVMERDELSLTREGCVQGSTAAVKAQIEAKYGLGAFPAASRYCVAVLEAAVRKDALPGLYLNLAVQQLGVGRELTFESQAAAIGDKPLAIIRNARAAAEAGRGSYMDAAGKERPLPCELAFDVGVTWGASRPADVDRPAFTGAQIEGIGKACYDNGVAEVKIGATGEVVPIQKIALIAGEILGRKYRLQR